MKLPGPASRLFERCRCCTRGGNLSFPFGRKTMRRYLFAFVLFALTTLVAVAIVFWPQSRGIRVTVINKGPETLSDVVVHVTGNTHRIGNLAVGESRTVHVSPTSESHVELAFQDHLGHPHRLNAGGYFEPGYRGTIEVELEAGAIKRNDHHVELSLY